MVASRISEFSSVAELPAPVAGKEARRNQRESARPFRAPAQATIIRVETPTSRHPHRKDFNGGVRLTACGKNE